MRPPRPFRLPLPTVLAAIVLGALVLLATMYLYGWGVFDQPAAWLRRR